MSFLLFKFCLPILLGYTLFVGLSGRFIPFLKPAQLAARPAWFLGLWTGLSVALVTGIAMHMSMQIPIDRLSTLAKPTAVLLGGLLTIGAFGYALYRKDVTDELRYQNSLNRNADDLIASGLIEIEVDPNDQYEEALASVESIGDMEFDNTVNLEPVTADIFEEAEIQAANDIVNNGDQGSVSLLFDQVATPNLDTGTPEVSEPQISEERLVFNETRSKLSETNSELKTTKSVLTETQSELAHTQSELEEKQSKLVDTESALTEKQSANEKLNAKLEKLTQDLLSEAELRSQTETHLRITRKALKSLEGDAREFEIEKANAIIEVESQLESHVKETASSQARANREEARRVEAQNKIVDLTQDLLQSKRELRQSTEARARALNTANKSVAFARKNVQARARAEARVKLLESRLKTSQQALKSRRSSTDGGFKEEVGTRIKRKLIRHREHNEG